MPSFVLLGAGSVSFTTRLVADMIRSGEAWDLRLVDTSEENLDVVDRLVRKMVKQTGSTVTVTASADRRQVLPGADVVVSTIGVGGRRAWEADVFIPREFGIYQPVGDSVMPGGISRALRQVPVLVAVAEDIADLCPSAWFFNYANPMSANCRAVRKATGVNVVGLCHGVFGVESQLASFAGIDPKAVTSTAVGVNHLTWFTELRYNGADAWPLVSREYHRQTGGGKAPLESSADAYLSTDARLPDVDGPLDGAPQVEESPFSWELFELYGAFPAVFDRHVTEFFPTLCREGAYYGKTLGVDAFSFEGTIERGDKAFARMQDLAASGADLPEHFVSGGSGEHEQLIAILQSLFHDRPRVYSVNLPNHGQAPNLPADAIIESPAYVSGAGFQPLMLEPLSDGIAATLLTRIASQELTVSAALEGSLDLFVQALLADGAVTVPSEARTLALALLEGQSEHLPQFDAGDVSKSESS